MGKGGEYFTSVLFVVDLAAACYLMYLFYMRFYVDDNTQMIFTTGVIFTVTSLLAFYSHQKSLS